MNKAELAARLADRLNVSKKQAEDMIEAFTGIVTDELSRQGDVTIAGFGTFSSRVRAARMGVNPQNPSERIRVPDVLVPKFKAGKALKDALKAAFNKVNAAEAPASEPQTPAPAPSEPAQPAPSQEQPGNTFGA